MQVAELVVRGFRNLADGALVVPEPGIALIGANGHGKTNLLEALAYPVLFRSIRGAPDREISRWGGPGFHLQLAESSGSELAATWAAAERRKRIVVDGEEQLTLAAAIGRWLVVGFFPTDLILVQGGAAERRRWCDRMLSLADREYFDALLRYRAALAQRNAALRRRDVAAARAFDPALMRAGALISAKRHAWIAQAMERWSSELSTLGESDTPTLRYRGDEALADAGAWPERLAASEARDLAREHTHVGPHRDDVVLGLSGRALREFGSTGQQRSAAIALRLLELETLADAKGVRPVLLVDDVFAELDADRQHRLAERLSRHPGQRIVTAPRRDDLPPGLDLPRWEMRHGSARPIPVAVA